MREGGRGEKKNEFADFDDGDEDRCDRRSAISHRIAAQHEHHALESLKYRQLTRRISPRPAPTLSSSSSSSTGKEATCRIIVGLAHKFSPRDSKRAETRYRALKQVSEDFSKHPKDELEPPDINKNRHKTERREIINFRRDFRLSLFEMAYRDGAGM